MSTLFSITREMLKYHFCEASQKSDNFISSLTFDIVLIFFNEDSILLLMDFLNRIQVPLVICGFSLAISTIHVKFMQSITHFCEVNMDLLFTLKYFLERNPCE